MFLGVLDTFGALLFKGLLRGGLFVLGFSSQSENPSNDVGKWDFVVDWRFGSSWRCLVGRRCDFLYFSMKVIGRKQMPG